MAPCLFLKVGIQTEVAETNWNANGYPIIEYNWHRSELGRL
jgi:hypothetical protein